MKNTVMKALAVALALSPAVGMAQSKPTSATYITDEDVKAVNALPGVDRTIKVVDIGNENYAIGVIHRGATAARGTGAGAGAGGGAARGGGAAAGGGAARAGGGAGGGAAAGRGAAQQGEPCGEQSTAPSSGGTPGMIAHDQQTEGYLIISGGGTLVTGGKIVNGRKSAPDAEVTKVLNGPSCSGTAVGADVVKKVVKTGDIIIIPAGVPHGWTDIGDHVDYLSFRPSARVLEAGYTNPAIKK
jgi:mannose-6-phosphate isomerase-like protein (cupin superfamily)